jgi:hypothetical protein
MFAKAIAHTAFLWLCPVEQHIASDTRLRVEHVEKEHGDGIAGTTHNMRSNSPKKVLDGRLSFRRSARA